jgi:hypothetical protein
MYEHQERLIRKQKEEDQDCFLVLALLVLAHREKIEDVEVAAGVLFGSLV